MKYLFKRQPKPIALAVATAVAMSCAGSTFAQDGAVEELVIQAERRDTTESTTAISMEVLTGEDLAENQVRGLEDLQGSVPNLQFNTNGYGWAQANIRGVGNPSGGGAGEQVGVPILFDGATQGEEIGLGGAIFDVGNVQVLRGPQGTFIGQSAAGGAILINSARPNFDGVNGYIEGQIATYDQEKVTGAINLPISDTLAARISFNSEYRGSYYSNQSAGRSPASEDFSPGSTEDRAFRLGFLWEPNDDFSAYMKIESTKFVSGGRPTAPSNRSFTGALDHDADPLTASIPVTTYSTYFTGPGGEQYAPNTPFQIASPFPQPSQQENLRFTLDLAYEFDNGISATSKTSYFEVDAYNTFGGNSNAYAAQFNSRLGPQVYTQAQEFTLISPEDQTIDWLVGVSASKRHTEVDGGGDFSGGQTCGWQYDATWSACSTAVPAGRDYAYFSGDTEIEQLGVYFQLDYELSDTIELTLGGRYNKDDNFGRGYNFFAGPLPDFFGNPPLDATTGVLCPAYGGQVLGLYCPFENMRQLDDPAATWSQSKGETPTYKLGINWEPSDNQFFYAFYARGYKASQPTSVDRLTGAVASGTIPIVEEIVDDYEFGWKGTLFDGAVYAELGYFFQDYQDMQLGGSFVTTATESGGGTGNIGGSEIEGLEGSLRTNIGNLNINASFGYTKSELNGISTYETRAYSLPDNGGIPYGDTSKGCVVSANQACFDFSPYQINLNGKENLNSPELSYNISVDYPISLDNGATLTPKLSLAHADESYGDIRQSPGENYYTRDERDTMNLSVTYDINDWSIQGFINNLTDEVYVEQAGGSIMYGDPRVVGLRARMNF